MELRDDILQTLQVYLQPLWHNQPAKLLNLVKKNTKLWLLCHSRSPRSAQIENLSATSC